MLTRLFFTRGFVTLSLIVLSVTWDYFAVSRNNHGEVPEGIVLALCTSFLVWTGFLLIRIKSIYKNAPV